MKKREECNKSVNVEIKRAQRLTCFLSDEEMAFIEGYLKKNNISNRSRWMRETLKCFIIQDMEDNYPTLFDEHEMRR